MGDCRGNWVLVAGSYDAARADGLDASNEGCNTANATTKVILLGTAQDAGVPQCGCSCKHCSSVLEGDMPPQNTTCLAILQGTDAWLVDVTPDVKWQLHILKTACPDYQLRGVFLTHLHMGHYTGLLHFAKEVMNTKKLPVYATGPACRFLRSNEPWCRLVMVDENIELHEIQPEDTVSFGDGESRFSICPTLVPHRGEYSDTVAYYVTGTGGRKLFYCPDIDSWDQWQRSLAGVCDSVDVQLVDSTFFSAKELPGRDISKIPHPFITNTAEHLPDKAQRLKTVLIHMNHTNPVYIDSSDEREWCLEKGFQIGKQGMSWDL